MTTRRRRQIATLTPAESYNAALQLHNQEFRTLGERNYAFLIAQSILVVALVTVLVNSKLFPYALIFIMWVIIMAGILFCISHHLAGRAGSTAAFIWRQYMLDIERNQQDTPWNWVYNYCEERHKKHGEPPQKRKVCTWLRSLLTRLKCDRCLLERSPLPIVWLITPGIFAGIWFAFSFYIARRLFIKGDPLTLNLTDFFPLGLAQAISIIVTLIAFGVLCYLICRFVKWFRTKTPTN